MCVSVCFARNNDEMFERDSIWSDTDKIFKERDRRDHLALLLVLRFSSTFSKRERPRALWMRSLFYLRFPRLLTRRSEEISATRDSTRLVECTRVTLFRLFCETGPKRRRGSRSVRTNFSVFKHARMGPIRCAGPESQHFRWEKMRVFPSQYPTARSLRSARKEREATPWVDSSGE